MVKFIPDGNEDHMVEYKNEDVDNLDKYTTIKGSKSPRQLYKEMLESPNNPNRADIKKNKTKLEKKFGIKLDADKLK